MLRLLVGSHQGLQGMNRFVGIATCMQLRRSSTFGLTALITQPLGNNTIVCLDQGVVSPVCGGNADQMAGFTFTCVFMPGYPMTCIRLPTTVHRVIVDGWTH